MIHVLLMAIVNLMKIVTTAKIVLMVTVLTKNRGNSYGERKPYENREGQGERRPYLNRDGQGERRPYENRGTLR